MNCELIWLAGLLEGEGFFFAQPDPRGGVKLGVRLVMSDRDVVERAAAAFSGATPIRSKNVPVGRKSLWDTAWYGPVAADLMWALLGEMGSRRTDRIVENLTSWVEHRINLGDRTAVADRFKGRAA